jgi:hypothetical protein
MLYLGFAVAAILILTVGAIIANMIFKFKQKKYIDREYAKIEKELQKQLETTN